MVNPKMTPEEKARADGYAAGVLAERDHTTRALAEVERLTRERDGCSEDGDGPCGACLKCARRERDEVGEMYVAAKGHLLRVGADLDAALARERAAANSVLEEAALVFESDRCPEDASITKVWWIYGSKIAAWLRGRKRS